MRGLDGKVAVVTGGGSGIGRATVKRLASEGCRVVVADWHAARGQEAADALNSAGYDVLFRHHDAGDPESWAALADWIEDRYGLLHILVNNAYSGVAGTVLSLSPDDLRTAMRVNVDGTLLGMQAASKLMAGGGAIVNLASFAIARASAVNAGYAAAKTMVVQLTRSAAVTLASQSPPIRVNAVAPGYTDTHALRATTRAVAGLPRDADISAELDRAGGRIPLGRIGAPDELASAIAFLASDEASYITGQCLFVDGGSTLL